MADGADTAGRKGLERGKGGRADAQDVLRALLAKPSRGLVGRARSAGGPAPIDKPASGNLARSERGIIQLPLACPGVNQHALQAVIPGRLQAAFRADRRATEDVGRLKAETQAPPKGGPTYLENLPACTHIGELR